MRYPRHFLLYSLLLLAMTIWGLSWTSGKILSQYTTTPILIFWRFCIASIAFIPIMVGMRQSPIISLTGMGYSLVGAVFLSLYNFFFFSGTRIGLPGAGGVLVTTMNPIFTFILMAMIARQKFYRKDMLGLILGFIGGSLILNIWRFSLAEVFASGNLYFILGALTWAFLTIITSRTRAYISTLHFSFWTFIFSALITLPFVVAAPLLEIVHFDVVFWLNLLLISVGAMAFATTIYFIGTVRLGSEKASSFIFAVPVSAMGFSMLFLGEKLTLSTAVGSVLAMLAVYLINKKHPLETAVE